MREDTNQVDFHLPFTCLKVTQIFSVQSEKKNAISPTHPKTLDMLTTKTETNLIPRQFFFLRNYSDFELFLPNNWYLF